MPAPISASGARRWSRLTGSGAAVGLAPGDLWVKRDDWLGLGGGGNKLRKLAPLCAAARAGGATTLITSGAAQSNYARLTAAAARRLGLEVTLVLSAAGEEVAGTGNLTLDGLLGADIVWAHGDASALDDAVLTGGLPGRFGHPMATELAARTMPRTRSR